MARYPRTALPPGYVLCEFDDHTYQTYRENAPDQKSPRQERRWKAVNWAWLQVAHEAVESNNVQVAARAKDSP